MFLNILLYIIYIFISVLNMKKAFLLSYKKLITGFKILKPLVK
uniref:Uncharacterized protein n=1 Tax=Myoviridae sp. cteo515 TaxID=2823550 RepID=A0A8S5LBP5_9CAUD|nr:MAG TPA: hypothetical protein [Myoviridae sp. cteo515]